MEINLGWIAFVGTIIIPCVGYFFNQIITKKIDGLEINQDKMAKLFFTKLDEDRRLVEDNCVRKDIYAQANKFLQDSTDDKFASMTSKIDIRFENIEEKLDEIKKMLMGQK